MFDTETKELEAALAKAVESCDAEVLSQATVSHQRALVALGTGDPKPTFGEYEPADATAATEMAQTIHSATAQAKEAITRFERALNGKLTAQPPTIDRDAVSFALSKTNVSPQELRALYDRYGGNYQLGSAIEDRAEQLGVSLGEDVTMDLAAAEDTISHIIANRYTYRHGSHDLEHSMDTPANVAARAMRALRHLDAFGKPIRHVS